MVSLVALVVWRLPIYVIIPCFLIFGTLDGLYLSSALTKVPDGAWFTLCLAVFLASIFVLWRFGKENQWQAEASDNIAPWKLLTKLPNASNTDPTDLGLSTKIGASPISRLRGIGIFFDKTGAPNNTPTVFLHFLQKFQAAPTVTVFFHIRPLSCPTVDPEDRFDVSKCHAAPGSEQSPLQNFYRVTIRHGYADNVISHDLGLLIYENLRKFVIREGSSNSSSSSVSPQRTSPPLSTHDDNEQPKASIAPNDDSTDSTTTSTPASDHIRTHLAALQRAYEDQVVYIVGKEQMRIGEVHDPRGWARRVALAAFLWLRSNTGSRVANMNLEVEKLVEVGFVKVI